MELPSVKPPGSIPPSGARVLIVFYSRTGYTRRVAHALARMVPGAEVEELRDGVDRSGVYGWLRSGFEGAFGRTVPILPLSADPSCFDIVVVATPTWARAVSSPVREFLSLHHEQMPNTVLICTHASDGYERVLHQMSELVAHQPLATLAVKEGEFATFARQARSVLATAFRRWGRPLGKFDSVPPPSHSSLAVQ